MIRLVTLSRNWDLLRDAIDSVEKQTRLADVAHVIVRDPQDGRRRQWGDRYPPSVFWNEEVQRAAPEDYVAFLSDDDILLPNYVSDLAGYLDTHPEAMAVYGGGILMAHNPPAEDYEITRYSADHDFIPGESCICLVGSGMTMIRKSCIDAISSAIENANDQVRLSDGIYIQQIVNKFGLPGTRTYVAIGRATRRSAHTGIDANGHFALLDWKRRLS